MGNHFYIFDANFVVIQNKPAQKNFVCEFSKINFHLTLDKIGIFCLDISSESRAVVPNQGAAVPLDAQEDF